MIIRITSKGTWKRKCKTQIFWAFRNLLSWGNLSSSSKLYLALTTSPIRRHKFKKNHHPQTPWTPSITNKSPAVGRRVIRLSSHLVHVAVMAVPVFERWWFDDHFMTILMRIRWWWFADGLDDDEYLSMVMLMSVAVIGVLIKSKTDPPNRSLVMIWQWFWWGFDEILMIIWWKLKQTPQLQLENLPERQRWVRLSLPVLVSVLS